MSEWLRVKRSSLDSVADSIRAKAGTEDKMVFPNGWKTTIDAIESGGSSEPRFGDDFPLLDGNTHFWVERNIEEQTDTFQFTFNLISGEITFNWGDGTSDTVTATGQQTISHVYPVGQYRIDIVANGEWRVGTGASSAVQQPALSRPLYLYAEIGNGVSAIGSQSLAGLYRLKEIAFNIGEGETCTIYNIVLQYAYSLVNCTVYSGTLKQGGTSYGSMFSYNTSLVEIDFTKFDYTALPNMFDYAYSLSKVTGLDGVTNINAYAFRNCYNLQEITLPSSITSIHANAFTGCSNLLDIYVPWSEDEIAGAPWGANATIHYNYNSESEV